MATLLLDIDGTIADFNHELVKRYNQKFPNEQISKEQFHLNDIYDCFDETVSHRLIDTFNEPGFFESLVVLPGAKKCVDTLLKKSHDIYIVTAPPRRAKIKGARSVNPGAASEKVQWVVDEFPKLAHNVMITSHKHLVHGHMLIDDNVVNIRTWATAHPNGVGYLVSQGWNATYKEFPDNVVRAPLDYVPEFLDKYFSEKTASFLPEYREWKIK